MRWQGRRTAIPGGALGRTTAGTRLELSGTPGRPRRLAPAAGEHDEEILRGRPRHSREEVGLPGRGGRAPSGPLR
jgi:hypothetical protein